MSRNCYIQLFEHQPLRVEDEIKDVRTGKPVRFREEHRKALEKYYGNGTPFFSLIHRGVKFNEHVGVLQTGNLTIEVLPKADNGSNDKGAWQKFLITMLRAAGIIPEATSTANLKLRSNSILDLYMQLFLQEARYLMQTGLVLKYRKTEGNSTALKGSLRFAQHMQYNLTHAERFYVRHTIYDRNNIYNAILLKTIELIKTISNQPETISAASALLLDFPECNDIKVSETLFNRLHFDRKTESYRRAIGMAKLLLLRYHPDVRQGTNDVLALMFDMNELWEKYVFRMLRKHLSQAYPSEYEVSEQVRTDFWKPDNGYMRIVKPDIVVKRIATGKTAVVLDTKWKRLVEFHPDDNDLKQMLIYNLYRQTGQSALVYPATISMNQNGRGIYQEEGHGCCSLVFVELIADQKRGMRLNLEKLSGFVIAN